MPDGISSGTWIDLMRQGEFEEAWKFSDEILKSGYHRDYLTLPRHYQCIWDGSNLAGKRVLIRCYHGLGDTIMFIRYAPLVKATASEVIVWAQPKLLDLLETAEGIDRLLPLHDGIPEAEYDIDVEIMELSHVFRTTLPTIPSKMPYLNVRPVHIAPEDTFNVGLVWMAGDWDLSRNVPFELLNPLFELDGINICILQDKAEDAGWREGYGIHPGECTLFDHARIIAGLDLMITVDSMPAHLAGAMNIPTWVLLSYRPDWRWMTERRDSPWYPSVRLFRQKSEGDWEGVIGEVIFELKKRKEN
ncbi:MAG TPA: hypothetical protein VK207_00845 [Bacteroidales bacterium]|nr:hypothetical protein [Bacteroidales bacterium]